MLIFPFVIRSDRRDSPSYLAGAIEAANRMVPGCDLVLVALPEGCGEDFAEGIRVGQAEGLADG